MDECDLSTPNADRWHAKIFQVQTNPPFWRGYYEIYILSTANLPFWHSSNHSMYGTTLTPPFTNIFNKMVNSDVRKLILILNSLNWPLYMCMFITLVADTQ